MARLPTIVSQIPRDLRQFLDRVRESLNLLENDIDGVDTNHRELTNALTASGVISPGVGGNTTTIIPIESPSTPTGLTASGTLGTIILTWNPAFYSGHAYTEVWVADELPGGGAPALGDAQLLGITPGAVFSDAVGSNVTRYYWIRFVNTLDEAGPYNSITPTSGTSGQDPSYLLTLLSGQITETELYSTLNTRIDLIDAAEGVGGSVNARIAAEASARDAADATLQGQINDLLSIADWDSATAYQTDDQVVYLGNLYVALQPSTNVLPTDPAYWNSLGAYTTLAGAVSDQGVRISDLEGDYSALVTQTDGLAAQIRGAYTGTDINLLSSGLVFEERQARVTADSAIASDVTTLDGRVTTAEGNITSTSSALSSLTTRVDATETNISTNATDITSLETSINDPGTGLAANAAGISALDVRVTANENGLVTQASSLDQVQATIDARELVLPLDEWDLSGAANQQIVSITDGPAGPTALRLVNGGYPEFQNFIQIDQTKTYRVKFWARPSADATGALYFSLRQYLADGTTAATNNGRSPYKPSGRTLANHVTDYGVDGSGDPNWGLYDFEWTSADWQTGVTQVKPEFLDNYLDPGPGVGHWDIQAIEITDTTDLVAAVQEEAVARASETGALFAQYTVKVETNGYVSGFGLASTATDAAPTSEFIVRSDAFAIASPSGPGITPAEPFIVRTTSTTINGELINPGVYITEGFIQNGTISTAKIGDLAVDTAKIADLAVSSAKILNLDATKITSGFIDTDRLQADSITADKLVAGSIGVDRLVAGTLSASNITAGSMTAAYLSVDTRVDINVATGALSAGLEGAYDATADGLFFGRTVESDSSTGFGFAAAKQDTVSGTYQRLELTKTNGLRVQNANFFRELQNPLTGEVTYTSNVSDLAAPAGTQFVNITLMGAGGGGADGDGNAGAAGTATTVSLYDGATLQVQYTANGGAGGAAGQVVNNGGTSGENSSLGTGGAAGVSQVFENVWISNNDPEDPSSGFWQPTITREGTAGSDATGYGAGGGGGGDATNNTSSGGNGGSAGQFVQVVEVDVRGYTDPRVYITIGTAGAGATAGAEDGGSGSPGLARVSYLSSASLPADVIPLSPTNQGTMQNDTFPDLGAGLWILSVTEGDGRLSMGDIYPEWATTGGGYVLDAELPRSITFVASGTPHTTGVHTIKTVRYAHFKMGP